jgi:hypothetical protein
VSESNIAAAIACNAATCDPPAQLEALERMTMFARRTLIQTISLFLLLLCGVPTQANDRTCTPNREGTMVCPEPDASCKADRTGEIICSTAGGGIELNRYGDPVCGPWLLCQRPSR